jgi:hypothetical protein
MRAVIRPSATGAAAAVLLMASISCGDVARTGRSPAMLIIDSLQAASGADPQAFSDFLLSDVQTLVERTVNGENVMVPTIFNDVGQATLRIELKDQGGAGVPASPSALNQVTLNRYRITFRRTDGRNTPGVDVPFGNDGTLTATVGASPTTVTFEVVQHQAKLDNPLRPLAGFGGRVFVTTIAEITFYGADLAGNAVQTTGTMRVSFADYADPL